MRLKQYIAEAEKNMERGDLQDSLDRIPKSHRKFLRGYKFFSQEGNTLKGDNAHIGANDLHRKRITVAAPWNYSREFATLHEVGHLVWMYLVAPCSERKSQWMTLVKNTNTKVKDNAEELFCHAYANTYAKHKIEAHNKPEWERFIKKLEDV